MKFIDMSENYPFTGVGNMLNFYNGLLKIKPNRKILFIFDNDTAGNEAYDKCVMTKQKNIKAIKLPVMEEFNQIQCEGPYGIISDNINGKAVSIELFLDLEFRKKEKPMVLWLSFNKRSKKYQGELIKKESYIKFFKTAIRNNDKNYNYKKLRELLEYIIRRD
ncbi:MAG: hypothetical protein U5P10_14930 [Spirochaetia bacterium]|nr:hypothetical protein [Spirochaetia bacterium]